MRPLLLALLLFVLSVESVLANDEQDCFQGMEPQLRIAGCSKLIQRNPNHAAVYHNRGVAYGLAGDIERAIADYTKVIEIDPRNATAYENRGRAYASKGDSENANADATKANELIAKSSKTSEQPARPSPNKPKKAKTTARPTKIAPANSSGWSWLWGNSGK